MVLAEFEKRFSSGPEGFCQKFVPKNFSIFAGKHLCRSLLFKKGHKYATLLKRDADKGVFCEFCKVLKNTFFTEHL